MSLTESIVEDAALTWFGELGYAVGHGPQMAPGEAPAEMDKSSRSRIIMNSSTSTSMMTMMTKVTKVTMITATATATAAAAAS